MDEDSRRKLIDEAMEAMEDAAAQTDPYLHRVKGIGCRDKAHNALPGAAELIEELTAEVARLHECMRQAGLQAFMKNKPPEEVAAHLEMVRESWGRLEATIATQAKEIERLVHLVAEVERRSAVAGRVVYEVRREMAND